MSINKNTIVRILLESEISSMESDNTMSNAGHINRTQYHDIADKIVKLDESQASDKDKEIERLKGLIEKVKK